MPKSLKDYVIEAEDYVVSPSQGDDFAINIREECLIESYIVALTEDGVVIEGDEKLLAMLEHYGFDLEEVRRYGAVGSSPAMGHTMGEADLGPGDHLDAIENNKRASENMFDRVLELAGCQRRMEEDQDAQVLAKKELDTAITNPMPGVHEEEQTDEAKYQGREVQLNKPMAGDVKKSKVYVRGPKGNVVKVNFGDPNMRIKKSDPDRRRSFRARHNCDNPGPKWKARYWSCRAW